MAESFNLFNRDNQHVAMASNGLVATSSTFVQSSVTNGLATYPGLLPVTRHLHEAQCRLASRQLQRSLKFVF